MYVCVCVAWSRSLRVDKKGQGHTATRARTREKKIEKGCGRRQQAKKKKKREVKHTKKRSTWSEDEAHREGGRERGESHRDAESGRRVLGSEQDSEGQ